MKVTIEIEPKEFVELLTENAQRDFSYIANRIAGMLADKIQIECSTITADEMPEVTVEEEQVAP